MSTGSRRDELRRGPSGPFGRDRWPEDTPPQARRCGTEVRARGRLVRTSATLLRPVVELQARKPGPHNQHVLVRLDFTTRGRAASILVSTPFPPAAGSLRHPDPDLAL